MAGPLPSSPSGARNIDDTRPFDHDGPLADGRRYLIQDDTVFIMRDPTDDPRDLSSYEYTRADSTDIGTIVASLGAAVDETVLRANAAPPPAAAAAGPAGPAAGPAAGPVATSRSSVKDLLIATYVGAAGANLAWKTTKTTAGGLAEVGAKLLRPIGSSLSTFGSTVKDATAWGAVKGWNVVDWKERGDRRESWCGRAAQWTWDAGSNVSRFGFKTATAAVVTTGLFLGGTGLGLTKGAARAAMDYSSIQYSPEGRAGGETRAAVKPAEIADACKSKLSGDKAQEIAAAGKTNDSIGLAMTALAEAGVDDPEAFLRGKGVLSSGPVSFGKRWSLADDRGFLSAGGTVKNRTFEALWKNPTSAIAAPGKWAMGFVQGKSPGDVKLSDLQQASVAFTEASEPFKAALAAVKTDPDASTGLRDVYSAFLRMPDKDIKSTTLAALEMIGKGDGAAAFIPTALSLYSDIKHPEKALDGYQVAHAEYQTMAENLIKMGGNKAKLKKFIEGFDPHLMLNHYSLMEDGRSQIPEVQRHLASLPNKRMRDQQRAPYRQQIAQFYSATSPKLSAIKMTNQQLLGVGGVGGIVKEIEKIRDDSTDANTKSKAEALAKWIREFAKTSEEGFAVFCEEA